VIYLLDTNIFLRVFVREDEEDYRVCRRLLDKIRNFEVEAVTAGVVLAEVSWVLGSYYRLPRQQAAEKLSSILKTRGLKVVDDYDWFNAAISYNEHNVKFLDAVLATMPDVANRNWTVISFDEDFKKLPVKWKLPKDVV